MAPLHTAQSAHAAESCPISQNTDQVHRAKALGVNPRAFVIPHGSARSTVRSNATLHDLRERCVDVLDRALTTKNPTGLAASLNVARTLVVRWLDKNFVDRRPAPMAWLLAMDDDEFEAVVAEMRRERAR